MDSLLIRKLQQSLKQVIVMGPSEPMLNHTPTSYKLTGKAHIHMPIITWKRTCGFGLEASFSQVFHKTCLFDVKIEINLDHEVSQQLAAAS